MSNLNSFKPYTPRSLWITSIYPCSSSNSRPVYMYNFSFMVASGYALPMSAPQTSILFKSARNIDSLKDFVEATPIDAIYWIRS